MPLFVFTGPEAGEKKTAIENLKKSLLKKAGAVDDYTFYATETDITVIMKLLLNESLFAAARFAVVHSAETIKKKEDIDLIKNWAREAERAKSFSTLILESAENGISKQLENIAPKENVKIFWEMFENKKEEWLRNFFAKAGYKIENGAIDTILGMIENNTESLAAECSRFFVCFDRGRVITPDDAESLLMHNREESAFTLFEALTRAELSPLERLETALAILRKMRSVKENSPQKILAGLFYCFRKIAGWREFRAEHPSPSQLDYKIAGFSARNAQTQYRNAERLWNPAQTSDCLALLASVEADTREGIPADAHDSLLETMLYALCIKNGARLETPVFAL